MIIIGYPIALSRKIIILFPMTTEDELRRFREEWKAEVSLKTRRTSGQSTTGLAESSSQGIDVVSEQRRDNAIQVSQIPANLLSSLVSSSSFQEWANTDLHKNTSGRHHCA